MYVASYSAGAACAYLDYVSLLSDKEGSDTDVQVQEALHASLRFECMHIWIDCYLNFFSNHKLSAECTTVNRTDVC